MSRSRSQTMVWGVVLAAMAGYFLLPIWWLLVAATKTRAELPTTPGLWFGDFALFQSIGDLVNQGDGIFLRWALNSGIYAVLGAAMATLIAAMAGYAFAKYRFRGREVLFAAVIAGVLVPPAALALPLFLLFSSASLTNTYWAVLIPSFVSPLGVYLSRIYAEAGVPNDLIEAGRLDGAGEFRIFFAVATRLMRPALVTIFLFQFVAVWNNFFLPLIMLSDTKLYPITLGLFSWNTQAPHDPDLTRLVIVGAFVSVVPLVAGFLMLQRYWSGGLMAGSVKG